MRSKRGFTAVEIMFAIGLFAIGAAGVLRMEKTAIQANIDARMFDQATAIARMWSERLARDATQWVDTKSTSATIAFGNATLLAGTTLNTSDNGAWVVPTTLVAGCNGACDGKSPYFDILGRDLGATGDQVNAIFCTNVRLTQLSTTLARAEVRVYWLSNMGGTVPSTMCSNPPPTTLPPATYHAVYASSALHMTPSVAQ